MNEYYYEYCPYCPGLKSSTSKAWIKFASDHDARKYFKGYEGSLVVYRVENGKKSLVIERKGRK